jgi:hypothetical protein
MASDCERGDVYLLWEPLHHIGGVQAAVMALHNQHIPELGGPEKSGERENAALWHDVGVRKTVRPHDVTNQSN